MQDRTIITVFDPDSGEAYRFNSEVEAYDFWRSVPKWEVEESNVAEGYCRSLSSDFDEHLDSGEDEREAREWKKHCQFYERAGRL